MYISNILSSCDAHEYMEEDNQESAEHRALGERLCKSLYFVRPAGSDRPSMPLTELAVEYFRDAAPKQLGRVDMDFASDVGRKAYASPCSLVVGMTYVRRLRQHGNTEYLQQVSSADLFLISMLVASKYLYDEGTDEEVFNDEWADAAGMETEEINQLEREFLQETEWDLFMSEKEFADVLRKVEMTIAFRKGRERGSFTYADLTSLTDDLNLVNALNALLIDMTKVVLVCCVAYLAGTLTLALSPCALSLASSCIIHQRTMDQSATAVSSSGMECCPADEHSTPTTATCQTCSSKINVCSDPDPSSSQQPTMITSIISVIKDLIGLWVLSTSSSSSVTKDNDWLCEFGPCGHRQQSVAQSCMNVTSQSAACTMSPCCCCQPMPNLNARTHFPHATSAITSLTFQTQAGR